MRISKTKPSLKEDKISILSQNKSKLNKDLETEVDAVKAPNSKKFPSMLNDERLSTL